MTKNLKPSKTPADPSKKDVVVVSVSKTESYKTRLKKSSVVKRISENKYSIVSGCLAVAIIVMSLVIVRNYSSEPNVVEGISGENIKTSPEEDKKLGQVAIVKSEDAVKKIDYTKQLDKEQVATTETAITAYAESGQWNKVIDAYNKLAGSPSYAPTSLQLLIIANAYKNTGNTTQQKQLLQRALEVEKKQNLPDQDLVESIELMIREVNQ